MTTPSIAITLADRRSLYAFWLGSAVVTAGVLLHLPMFWMARDMGFVLAGMKIDAGMAFGMALIFGGVGMTCYGLLPRTMASAAAKGPREIFSPPEEAPLTRAHWTVMVILGLTLVIDIMKPASLGFVTPGMRVEYGVGGATIAWLPFAALTGTTVGSFVWGVLADIYGRRATILLSSIMFVGTSICGAMPSFWWNVGMCFLMGAAAGGLLPVAYALLAEIMPTRHRGWCLVLVGSVGAVGGYFAASFFSELLQPVFGWRIMWFLNLPTGLIVIALSAWLPESARFLQHVGRHDEARAVLKRFGSVAIGIEEPADSHDRHAPLPPFDRRFAGMTAALTAAALAWGLVNFGLLLWLPGALVDEGRSFEAASKLIARSSLIALPVVVAATLMYSRWSAKWSLAVMIAAVIVGLALLLVRQAGVAAFQATTPIVALLVAGSSGVIAILLPYTAEAFPLRIRGRASGWIAGCSKLGGLLAQGFGLFFGAPALGAAALTVGVPAAAALALIAAFGPETRGRDLREIDG
ncbi:MAG: MFS transporter [Pseudomonadota bacterium]